MSYIGNQPTSVAFLTDQFSGTGSQTAFTLSAAPANTASIIVAVSGVLQDPTTYSTSGLTLTFSAAPPSGTGNISVRFLGIPASNIATTAYRTQTEFTATAGQTTFSVPSYTPGFIDVYRNGVLLGSADFTATSGTTVVLAAGATAGDLVETISFYVSSVLNAIPAVAGAVTNSYLLDGSVTPAKLSTGGLYWDTLNNVGIGTTSPSTAIGSGNLGFVFNGGSNGVQFKLQNATTGSTAADGVLLALDPTAGAYLWNYENSFFAFGTNNLERMRIDNTGRILFNTLVAYNTDSLMSVALTPGGYQVGTRFRPTNNNTYYPDVYDNNAGATVGYIQAGTSSTSFVTSSDYRLKDNVAPMTDALSKVALLKPCTYTWKESGEASQGFIAHELQEVVPECVTGEKDAVNEDGSIKAQGIDTSFLVATLTAAIQELKAEVDSLKAEVTALKGAE
jgi:hypothetical protein